jgi:hypothetical protein
MEHCDGGTLAHVLATAHRKGSSIDWNNFDIGGCDGYKEPLGPTTSLMFAAVAPRGRVDDHGGVELVAAWNLITTARCQKSQLKSAWQVSPVRIGV